jgi:ubiquinone biosynthesis protein
VDVTVDLSFWELLVSALFVLSVGFVSGRVLGVHRGFLRATAAGILGSFIGLIIAVVVATDDGIYNDGVLPATFAFAVLVTMLLSIVLDVVLRPRRRGRGRLTTRVRAFSTVGGRIAQVSRIARRNGLANPRVLSRAGLSTPATARRIRLFLEECGGMFVKFGQIASTRSDLLPSAVVTELTDLQSNVHLVPVAEIRQRIEDELQAPIADLFAEFSDTPLAAASIGQTHLATLHDGRSVVVKVRRPAVEIGVARDSAVLRWASRAATRRSASARSLGLIDMSEELIRSIEQELSYTAEAANGRALASVLTSEGVAAPAVVTAMSTDAVLVLNRVHGRPVSDTAAVDACGVARPVLAGRLFGSFMGQILTAGVVHADPHPGNILVDGEGRLWLIDFGAVGIIDPVTLEALQLMAAGFVTGQPALITRALRSLTGAAGDAMDLQSLDIEISRLLGERLSVGGFDPAALQDIISLMQRHELPVPPSLTILGRTMVTLEGTLRIIDPSFDLASAAMEHAGGGLKASDLREELGKDVVRNLPSLRALPGLTEDVARQVRAGRLRLQLEPFAGSGAQQISTWVDRMLFTLVAIGGLVGSAVLLVGAGLGRNDGNTDALFLIGYLGLFLSAVMLMRMVAQILRRDDAAR